MNRRVISLVARESVWPRENHGDADAAFVEITLATAEFAIGVVVIPMVATSLGGAIVAGEADDGVFFEPEFLGLFED